MDTVYSDPDDNDDAFLGAVRLADMVTRQQSDPELRQVIAYIDGPASAIPRGYKRVAHTLTLRDNDLYEKKFEAGGPSWLLVVAENLRQEVVEACHDNPASGPLGYSRRTLARLREKYYWLYIPKVVRHYTKTCREYQRRKRPPTRPVGLLQPINPPSVPFRQVGMDLLGPFPTSNARNRWIVVATDDLTRYAETKALPLATISEIVEFFIQSIVLRHGTPEIIITVLGSVFTAQLIQDILRMSHTNHRRTTTYHPQQMD